MILTASFNIFFSIGFALILLGVMPLWSLISKTNAYVTENEALIVELKNLQQRKDQLVKTYNSVSEDNIRKLEAVIPVSSGSFDASFLYLFFENFARENGLRLESVAVLLEVDTKKAQESGQPKRPGTPVFQVTDASQTNQQAAIRQQQQVQQRQQSIVRQITVSLKIEGSYESFKAFLQAIESNLRLMDIQGATVSRGDGTLTYTLTLKTYFQ